MSGAKELVTHIRTLRAELERTTDPAYRQILVSEIEKAKKQKVQHFKSQAKADSDDAAFIHLFSQ